MTEALNLAVSTIYQLGGIARIPSAWLGALLVWLAFASLLFGATKTLVWATRTPTLPRAYRLAIWLLVVALSSPVLLVAVGLTARIRAEHGLRNSDLFGAYFLALIALGTGPFWYVLWKAGFLSNDSA